MRGALTWTTLHECSPKWARPRSWLRAVTGLVRTLSAEAAPHKESWRPSLLAKPAASTSISRASCKEGPLGRGRDGGVPHPTPPSKAGTGEGLVPSQGGRGPRAHREVGMVVREGCGALAGTGQPPCWAWRPLPAHSHLGKGNIQATSRLQGGQGPRKPPGALPLLGGHLGLSGQTGPTLRGHNCQRHGAETRVARVAPPAPHVLCVPHLPEPPPEWAGLPVTPTPQTGTPRPRGSQAESGFECRQPCSEPTPAAPGCAHPGSTEVGGGHEPHSTPRTASCWPHLGSQSHPLG